MVSLCWRLCCSLWLAAAGNRRLWRSDAWRRPCSPRRRRRPHCLPPRPSRRPPRCSRSWSCCRRAPNRATATSPRTTTTTPTTTRTTASVSRRASLCPSCYVLQAVTWSCVVRAQGRSASRRPSAGRGGVARAGWAASTIRPSSPACPPCCRPRSRASRRSSTYVSIHLPSSICTTYPSYRYLSFSITNSLKRWI